ncbi:MAG: hypothetical protein HOP08_01405 [Cyclobacteriaceae bacterium]|nr:hypothetical protein [Cyclobacteriaceae bacterium]
MNLNNLKPAWRQLVLFNSMQSMDQKDILSIIEQADIRSARRLPGLLINTLMFIILTVCCQGG